VQQRREHPRYELWFPVRLAAGEQPKIAMNHNIGAGGMLVALATHVDVGETVVVTFRLPGGDSDYNLRGKVLRLEPNSLDPEGGWPHRVAIGFDDIAPELLPYLEAAVARISQI